MADSFLKKRRKRNFILVLIVFFFSINSNLFAQSNIRIPLVRKLEKGVFNSIRGFVLKLLKSSILPTESVQFFSYFIPAIELVTVVLLLVRTVWGFYMSFILMCAFTFYLVLLNSYSNYSGCSCGGILDMLGFKSHIVFNVVYIAICIMGIILYSSKNNDSQQVTDSKA